MDPGVSPTLPINGKQQSLPQECCQTQRWTLGAWAGYMGKHRSARPTQPQSTIQVATMSKDTGKGPLHLETTSHLHLELGVEESRVCSVNAQSVDQRMMPHRLLRGALRTMLLRKWVPSG